MGTRIISPPSSFADAPDTRPLVDFFNHGMLPFVGREKEAERLVEFWRGTAESNSLRTALLLGEAGMGKSRLLEEVLPRIARLGGVVVHAKLYPGSSTSLAPLLARAIRYSGSARQLLKKEPEENIGSVIEALERVARLRPLLLVIEDAHLLGGEALNEFSVLLDSLSTEALSLLALARPIELGIRGIIERYLVEEIELRALDVADLNILWKNLFQAPCDLPLLQLLADATLGNALALRSALRGVLKSEEIFRDAAGVWRSALPLPQLAAALERNIQILSEGMAAHLNPEEKRVAEEAASLGEVFSREAVRELLPDAGPILDILIFKGVLVRASSSISPLPGIEPGRSHPLTFTHTLLHKHLAAHAPVDATKLLRIMAAGIPLYSVLPFQLLAEHAGSLAMAPRELEHAIERVMAVAMELDRTPDWELGWEVFRAAEALFGAHGAALEPLERRELQAEIVAGKLSLLRREDYTPKFMEEVNRLVELTEEPASEKLRTYRILARKFHLAAVWRTDPGVCRRTWGMVEEILESTPKLRFTHAYISYLNGTSAIAASLPDDGLLRMIELRLREIMESPEPDQEFKAFAWKSIAQFLLRLFDTPEELQQRLELLAELEASVDRHDITFFTLKIPLFESIGNVEELRRAVDAVLPLMKERGVRRPIFQYRLLRLCADAWFDLPIEELEAKANEICMATPPEALERLRLTAGVRLIRIGLFRGSAQWVRSVVETFLQGDERQLAPHDRIMLAAAEGKLTERLPDLLPDLEPFAELASIARAIINPADAGAIDTERLREVLAAHVICREDLLTVCSIADLLDAASAAPHTREVAEGLLPDLRVALVRLLEWLRERSFFGFMLPILERYGKYLGKRELAEWRARAEGIAQAMRSEPAPGRKNDRLRLTMLGTIEACREGEEPIKLRGARLRTVLGLLVASMMLEKSLSYREFCRLAAGGEDDPERARKMVSMAVLRLREAIGADAILNDGETPRLDPERVEVDLVEAHNLLREATALARRGGLMRALPLLLEAFRLIGTDVPFPALYDDFFEALREDFEFKLRDAVAEIGGGLLREGDPASAEEALRRGFEAMPEDEEITAWLCEALEQQGKRAEAERVRMRAMAEV